MAWHPTCGIIKLLAQPLKASLCYPQAGVLHVGGYEAACRSFSHDGSERVRIGDRLVNKYRSSTNRDAVLGSFGLALVETCLEAFLS